jgi:purine-binding chemotaxis protein CheW
LAEPTTPPAPSALADRYVVFRVAAERFGLPLAAIREVVPPLPPFARVPKAGSAVRGVMNLRGRVVAVVDLAELMGLVPQPLAAGAGQVLILDRDKRALGLLVGQVQGVEALPPVAGPAAGAVAGLTSGAAGAVTLLQADQLAAMAAALFGGG